MMAGRSGVSTALGGLTSVARHTVVQCLRMKVVGATIVILGLLLGAMPFAISGDGTLAGRSKTFLSYSMALLSVVLSVLTVFLSIWVVSEDIRTRQIYGVIAKPLARWQYILGRWLGVCILNAGLLAVAAAGVFALAQYLRSGAISPEVNPQDRVAVETQVFTARTRVGPASENVEKKIADRIEEMQRTGQYADALEAFKARTGGDEAQAQELLIAEVRENITGELFAIKPRESKTWRFEGIDHHGRSVTDTGRVIRVDKESSRLWVQAPPAVQGRLVYGGPIRLNDVEGTVIAIRADVVAVSMMLEDMLKPAIQRLAADGNVSVTAEPTIQLTYKAELSQRTSDRQITSLWRFEATGTAAQLLAPRHDLSRSPATMTIPAWVVSDDGRTTVTFLSQPHRRTGEWYTVRILPEDVAILFRVGSFGWNFLRGTLLLMAQLAYLAAVGVFAGSFLVFPVGCMLAFSLLPFSVAGTFLREAVDPDYLAGPLIVSYYIVHVMGALLPDFESTAPGRWFVDGMAIPWRFVGKTLLWTVLIRTSLALAVGCMIFRRRELARVQA